MTTLFNVTNLFLLDKPESQYITPVYKFLTDYEDAITFRDNDKLVGCLYEPNWFRDKIGDIPAYLRNSSLTGKWKLINWKYGEKFIYGLEINDPEIALMFELRFEFQVLYSKHNDYSN